MLKEWTEFTPAYSDWVFVLGPRVADWQLMPGSMVIIMSTDTIKLKGR